MDKKYQVLKIMQKIQNSKQNQTNCEISHNEIIEKCPFNPSPTLLWLHTEDYISRYNNAGNVTYLICPKGEDYLAERIRREKDERTSSRRFWLSIILSAAALVVSILAYLKQ